ncbi:MAG: 2-oxoacid:acceptor oxidoreductase family protein [Candidatus Sumerlaeia bacterium]
MLAANGETFDFDRIAPFFCWMFLSNFAPFAGVASCRLTGFIMQSDILSKPSAFQETFVRKPSGSQKSTHYCPGCGHGVMHKLIAEAISDLEIQDRVVFAAPVGCSVFLYYYFGCSTVSVPHGRAPAALTGVSRVRPDAINISYQGDGDLAAIGTAEIIHAANRGERIAVFFVNNAIYGMTGGQMAPTTLPGMKTATSPYGRDVESEGYPMRMCEMISTLEAPIYVERVSLDSPKATMKARAAIRKSLQLQKDRKGFTFVEILSPCPTNWKVSTDQANEWIREKMHPVFPPGVFKDISANMNPKPLPDSPAEEPDVLQVLGIDESQPELSKKSDLPIPMLRCKMAGFGGQGVLLMGILLAQAGMTEGYEVSWIPSYGPEMRGGTANSSVILSRSKIGSPVVNEIDVLLAMNAPSLDRFLKDVQPGGIVIYNSSIVKNPPEAAEDITIVGVPVMDLAKEAGEERAANMVMLGAYNAIRKAFDKASVEAAMKLSFLKPALVEVNQKAYEAGARYVENMKSASPTA